LILDETEMMQTLRGLTDGVVKVVQEAAVAAVTSGAERIDPSLLGAWREAPTRSSATSHRVPTPGAISSVVV
jgi:hypothetical protein